MHSPSPDRRSSPKKRPAPIVGSFVFAVVSAVALVATAAPAALVGFAVGVATMLVVRAVRTAADIR